MKFVADRDALLIKYYMILHVLPRELIAIYYSESGCMKHKYLK